ncbi:MaoC family dehydratase [Acinetobacter sp. ANC 4862]|uniref:MaoC family dehydratase n=1 Tax=Acinetobacter sp. ANC 4862 TaxID=2529849 RepID=UPI00103D3348|nr:MaoC family dehydratase [Acinetobacter sp. ANC 4862]TCH64090.1 MaoC family dehydratase [Acinetobacter sp. ANC 4862]
MEIKNSFTINEIQIGMTASYSQTITDADVKAFSGISGDHNPVHVSEEYAKQSRFKDRIAHGLLTASFFSAIFGTKLPGEGCIYVSQNLQFKRPVYLGDTVVAKVTVIAVDISKKRVAFETVCSANGKVVTTGTAEIFIP